MESPYLAQVLAQMGQAPAPTPHPGIDPAMLAQVMQQRKANPDQPRGLGQAMQNLRGVPQRLGQIPSNVMANLQGLPGQVGNNLGQIPGLLGLGRRGVP